jgi:hypothetical protein
MISPKIPTDEKDKDPNRKLNHLLDLGELVPKDAVKLKASELFAQTSTSKNPPAQKTKNPEKREHTVHRYVRHDRRRDFYRCADKYCYHFMDRGSLIGKASLCNMCKQEFELSRDDLRRKKPVCYRCSNTAKAQSLRKIMDQTADVFTETTSEDQENEIIEPGGGI